jgi:hypothetical protein
LYKQADEKLDAVPGCCLGCLSCCQRQPQEPLLVIGNKMHRQNIYEQTLREYRRRLAGFNLAAVARVLGVVPAEAVLEIPFLGDLYRVGPAGVSSPAGIRSDFASCVVLMQLLLRCPAQSPEGGREWTAFRDFADAAPLTGFFAGRVEGGVIRAFSGRLPQLHAACTQLASRPQPGFTHDLARRFEVLPQLPLLLLFNDAGEELPAACSLLFERRAISFLDMECLAITAELLVDRLIRHSSGQMGQGKR